MNAAASTGSWLAPAGRWNGALPSAKRAERRRRIREAARRSSRRRTGVPRPGDTRRRRVGDRAPQSREPTARPASVGPRKHGRSGSPDPGGGGRRGDRTARRRPRPRARPHLTPVAEPLGSRCVQPRSSARQLVTGRVRRRAPASGAMASGAMERSGPATTIWPRSGVFCRRLRRRGTVGARGPWDVRAVLDRLH